jgi:hypothetical protein
MGNRAFQSGAVVRDLFMQRLPAALFDSYERFRLIHGTRTNHETVRNLIRRAKAGRLQDAIDRYIPISGQARACLLGLNEIARPLPPTNDKKSPRSVNISGFRQWLEAQVRGHSHQASQRICLHLPHHLAPVRLHRDL